MLDPIAPARELSTQMHLAGVAGVVVYDEPSDRLRIRRER
jgi:hypothetical protein